MDTKNQIMKEFRENFVNFGAKCSVAGETFDQDIIPRMPKERFAPLRKFSAEQR
jgi:hypothetical protein